MSLGKVEKKYIKTLDLRSFFSSDRDIGHRPSFTT